jgi:branched-chain amino acid transport system substrate-binding protein
MKKSRIWIALLIVAAVVIAVVATRQGTFSQREVVIGAVSPFSGDGAPYGRAARNGIELALDEINANGGVRGARLVVRYEDDKGNPSDAVSAFQKLAIVDRVPAILGPFYSGNVLACAPVANRLKVVLLTGSATSDNIRKAGQFVFRTCPSNDEQARTIAAFAFEKLGLRTAYVIYRNADYGVTLRDAFQKAYPKLGGTILGTEAVEPDASDIRPQLSKIKASNPAFIFAAVHYPEGGALLRQARELGISAVVLGTDGGYDPQLLRVAGDAAEGSYWATVGWADEASNPAVKKFKQTYHARYGEEPGVYSALYYDAVHVLAKAMVSAPSLQGEILEKTLRETRFEGPTGLTKFDEHGDVAKPFSLYQIREAKFVPVSVNQQLQKKGDSK